MLPESSSWPLPATLAQSRNLAHASLETAVVNSSVMWKSQNSHEAEFKSRAIALSYLIHSLGAPPGGQFEQLVLEVLPCG